MCAASPYAAFLYDTKASAVILAAKYAKECPVDCLITDNPYLAHARVTAALYPDAPAAPGVHPEGTGAEEDHMVGAMRWLDTHLERCKGQQVFCLNFDGAGAPGVR